MNKKIPMRKCVGCGEMKPKKNGRGAYLCPCKACFDLSVKSHGLERSFKQEIPQEVYEKLAKEMERIGQR